MRNFFGMIVLMALASVCTTEPIQAEVRLVEEGHTLSQLVDSREPLHPSQTALDTDCVFGDNGSIESIGVDLATGMLYVQLQSPIGASRSEDTCVFSLAPTGVVQLITPSTGFGINARGTDLHVDPATGLLVTQDQNSTPPRIATVNPQTGEVGTYAPAPFRGGTFGMDFSAGAGGSAVPADGIVFTTAVSGSGIYSAVFGAPESLLHVNPIDCGDDVVVQPDGDWVHATDCQFGSFLAAYSPAPPHDPTLSPLSIRELFRAAALPFAFGTRATACRATGDLYISFSGTFNNNAIPGGTGIFRVDQTLTTATLVLTISEREGLQDLTLGPASSEVGNSVYFTIHDFASGGEEVWEVTVPECSSGLFFDAFDRADSGEVGNGWVEKTPEAFALTSGVISKAATATGYQDNLVYRPADEAMLDGEVSVEVRFTSLPPGYAQVFVRGQLETITQAGMFDGYLFFIDNDPARAFLSRIENGTFMPLAEFTLRPTLNTTDTFRLRLRATGSNPVILEAFVERFTGIEWVVIGHAVVNDTASTQIVTPGTVGFTGFTEGGQYTFDNFIRRSLDNGTLSSVPMISGLAPNVATVGEAEFSLTVIGRDFAPSSVVRWNGEDRPTTFVSPTELTVDITAADLAVARIATVTVFTAEGGGGLSNPINFFVLEPGSSVFSDDFNRPDDTTLGNGWMAKCPDAFALQNNEVVSIDTFPIDYHDTIVIRPVSEDRRDVEISMEFRLLPGLHFPQVHARIQRDTLEQPDTLGSYLFFVDGSTSSPGQAFIAIQAPVPGQFGCGMLAIPFTSPLLSSERYRLRFRVTGAESVTLTGIVEWFNVGTGGWQEFAMGTIMHNGTTERDPNLFCDPGVMPPPITEAGAIGFAKASTNNEILDNFFWLDLSEAN